MNRLMLTALGVATLAFAVPAAAQDYPLTGGDFWTVAEISIDDGHFGDYADHLSGLYRKTEDFAKSKGWIKGYHILSNVNKRSGEPDLYLVTIADRIATPAEDQARETEMNAYLSNDVRKRDSQSAARAKFRHLGGSMLLQEMLYKR